MMLTPPLSSASLPITCQGLVCSLGSGLRWLVLAVLLTLATIAQHGGAGAVEPDEILSDPKLEARARELSLNLRCLVCQNQSIDDSNAPLARDLRLLVRERLKAGDTNVQVMDYIVARYGEFVLLKPPLGWHTVLLWLTPLLLLAGAVGYIAMRMARGSVSDATSTAAQPLSADERRRLDRLLAEDDGGLGTLHGPGTAAKG